MLGWYAYAFAAEPFVVSAVATYVPLLLEGLARDNAVLAIDHRSPCRVPGNTPGLLPTPIAPPKCVVKLGWIWIDTSSLPLYTFSVSVAVQMAVVISISGLADRSFRSRKSLLVGFAIVGSIATIVMASAKQFHYYVAAAMAVVANASFGAVTVCGNAYIPALVSVEQKKVAGLLAPVPSLRSNYGTCSQSPRPRNEDVKSIASRISGRGAAIGYASALVVQVITMAMLVLAGHENSSSKLRNVIIFIGWWWLIGQIPVILFLNITEEDAGDTLLPDEVFSGDGLTPDPVDGIGVIEQESVGLISDVASGWVGLMATIRRATKLQDISMFLVGWFLLSDAVTTINSTAVLFARTNLGMATPALALIGLITVIFAIVGSLVCSRGFLSNSLVMIALIGSSIPCYGVLGFFQPWIGLNHAWELYALASWYGFMLGALNAVTRSMYAFLIPKGQEVTFFALYAVTDKGSSILGPTVTGLITDYTHNIRYTFYFLLGMMLLAASVFSRVDYERGQRDAAQLDAAESDETTGRQG